MTTPLDRSSDKIFWHGFVDFYETHLRDRPIRSIAEFGVFKGNSVRWMLDRFPEAQVTGIDILPEQPEWPKDPRVTYHRLDQDDRAGVRDFFAGKSFDLIIEDGSHRPHHQAHCLVETIGSVSPGGIYILEDIHTSMPQHALYRRKFGRWGKTGTALSTLLALDHLRRIGQPLTADRAAAIAADSLFRPEEISALDRHIAAIHLYRRTRLPDACYACGATEFDYARFRCTCGVEIFACADSMSFVIERSQAVPD